MLFSDLLQETYFALSANKARSALTVLGIVIGISSVVIMVALGQGVTQDITDDIQSLGSNLLMVSPSQDSKAVIRGGSGSVDTLTIDDALTIEKNISLVTAVAPQVSAKKQVISEGENTNTNIYGVNENYPTVNNIEIKTGSFISQQNVKKLSKVAVLGPETRDNLFAEDVNPVGEKIRIDKQQFTVIGVTQEKGGSGFTSSDDLIYIPISTAQHYLTGSDSVNLINVQIMDEDSTSAAEEQITSLLLTKHGIKNPVDADFSILSQTDLMDTVSSVTGILTLLLGSIAGISLLVGGVGIMNMMLTTVTERTREIGLRKSLGAKSQNINNQFLAESVALTFVGGIIGLILAFGASALITKFTGMSTLISSSAIMLAFGVSAAIGIIFGYYPARRAAKLNPIEALRYE